MCLHVVQVIIIYSSFPAFAACVRVQPEMFFDNLLNAKMNSTWTLVVFLKNKPTICVHCIVYGIMEMR